MYEKLCQIAPPHHQFMVESVFILLFNCSRPIHSQLHMYILHETQANWHTYSYPAHSATHCFARFTSDRPTTNNDQAQAPRTVLILLPVIVENSRTFLALPNPSHHRTRIPTPNTQNAPHSDSARSICKFSYIYIYTRMPIVPQIL